MTNTGQVPPQTDKTRLLHTTCPTQEYQREPKPRTPVETPRESFNFSAEDYWFHQAAIISKPTWSYCFFFPDPWEINMKRILKPQLKSTLGRLRWIIECHYSPSSPAGNLSVLYRHPHALHHLSWHRTWFLTNLWPLSRPLPLPHHTSISCLNTFPTLLWQTTHMHITLADKMHALMYVFRRKHQPACCNQMVL